MASWECIDDGLSHAQPSDCLYGQGLCSSGRGGLWYIVGLRGLWLWFRCGVPREDVVFDWMDVFPRPVVSLSLGLNVVVCGIEDLPMMVPGMSEH